ncbi:MAG: transglutaminase domain-containing protein [Wenzhouxiangellaceae bacterium]|nr:transglutaminase domain-containing protein [Wenzhouxiangellaceae bacterium]
MKNFLSNAICVMTAVSIAAFPYHAARAASPDAPEGFEELEREIDELGRKAERLRSTLKRERFDPEEFVFSAAFELDALVEFVRDEIAFHPYEGTLRGAAGTLRARAGNSLDQALLLAQMIRSAGFDARIVRSELTGDAALRLLDAAANAPEPPPLDYFGEAIARTFGERESERIETRPIERTSYHEDTQRQARELLDVLERAGIELAPVDATGRLLESVREYFWVQHRVGPSDAWQPAHPAFGSSEPPAGLEPAEFFAESIPTTYQHRFEMRAWIEQWVNGKIEKHPIMSTWSAPTANLNGVDIRFHNVPNGINGDETGDLDEVLANTEVLTPFVGKAAAPGAMAFDLQGRVIDPMAQSGSPAAGIIKTVGDKFVDAAGGVTDRPDGEPVMALHSMYLEFTFHRPDGESESRRRYLLPPRQTYKGDRAEVLRPLITGYTYVVSTGGQPREFIADRFIEGTVADLDWLEYVAVAQSAPDRKHAMPGHLLSPFPTLFQQWNMERWPAADGVVRFRGQPALVGIRDGFRDARTVFSEVDVVWNEVESLKRSGEGWVTSPKDTLTAGVWDTVLESLPLSAVPERRASLVSTPGILDLAREQGIDLLVLHPGRDQDERIAALPIEEHERLFVRRDLDAGFAVVIPERTPDRSPMAGWWRVRPDTGVTLGMLGDGHGATAAEYIVVLTFVALAGAVALRATTEYFECGGETVMKDKLCCALEKHMSLVQEEAEGDDVVEESGDAMLEQLCGND